jgi:hypothetical protein
MRGRGPDLTGGEARVAFEQWLRTFLLVNVYGVFAGALAEGAIAVGVLGDAAGRRVGPLRMLGAASERYARLLAVSAVCVATVMAGFLLVPLLGLLLQSLVFIALPVAVAEPGLSVGDVFRRTWELGRGRRLLLFIVVACFTAAGIAADVLLRRLGESVLVLPGWATLGVQASVATLLGGFTTVLAVEVYAAFAAAPPD